MFSSSLRTSSLELPSDTSIKSTLRLSSSKSSCVPQHEAKVRSICAEERHFFKDSVPEVNFRGAEETNIQPNFNDHSWRICTMGAPDARRQSPQRSIPELIGSWG